MGRTLSTLIAAACVATVATQALAAGMMWWHGRLTPTAWQEVKDGPSTETRRRAVAARGFPCTGEGAPSADRRGPAAAGAAV